jgi:hypothetical protein
MVDGGPSGHHFTMVAGGGYTCQYHWYSLITVDETTGMAPQAPRSPERAAASKCGTIIQDFANATRARTVVRRRSLSAASEPGYHS